MPPQKAIFWGSMESPTIGRFPPGLLLLPGGLAWSDVFAEHALPSRNAKTMIRDGAWKYTCWAHDIPELYNLESDPDELHNVAAEPQYAAKAAELRSRALAWNPIA